jgi:hypothetical protein
MLETELFALSVELRFNSTNLVVLNLKSGLIFSSSIENGSCSLLLQADITRIKIILNIKMRFIFTPLHFLTNYNAISMPNRNF